LGSFRLDSVYSRAGDYSAFYTRDIPVLALYAGPDDNDCNNGLMIVKFIYDLVSGANTRGKLAFARLNQ
jgi:hypothetical protein